MGKQGFFMACYLFSFNFEHSCAIFSMFLRIWGFPSCRTIFDNRQFPLSDHVPSFFLRCFNAFPRFSTFYCDELKSNHATLKVKRDIKWHSSTDLRGIHLQGFLLEDCNNKQICLTITSKDLPKFTTSR